jgi:hypothetical protein
MGLYEDTMQAKAAVATGVPSTTYLKDEGDRVAGVVVEMRTETTGEGADAKEVPVVVLSPAEYNGQATDRIEVWCYRGGLKKAAELCGPGATLAARNEGQKAMASGPWKGRPAWVYDTRVIPAPANDLPVSAGSASPAIDDGDGSIPFAAMR